MSRLTWVQPPDLLTHELVASAADGVDVSDVRDRWVRAGGDPTAPASGRAQPGDAALRALAEELLDELDRRERPADLLAREPDDLAAIESTWLPGQATDTGSSVVDARLRDRVLGGWTGRAVGCLLGKPVEKIPRQGIREILVSQDRWPLRDWFTAEGLPADVARRWPWNRRSAPTSLAENIDGMPEDDDLNFPMLALDVLERHGRGFDTDDVSDAWLASLPAGRVFTAERVAYRNLLLGEDPPRTATRHNPFREWIGAQIRADVFGWACPGDPVQAARLAWRDARLSHVRSGLYGAMFVAAACATAVVADDAATVLETGLSVVPPESRYAAAVRLGMELGASGHDDEECVDVLYRELGDLHWVHVLNNAALLAFAVTRGDGDLEQTICRAVAGGWDTDSVGATAGSLAGALTGAAALPERWTAPLRNRVASTLPGFDGIGLDELARRTVAVAQRTTHRVEPR